MGAYFIRRGSRNTLYRRVLARYVQMATADGTTQAMFPEGGLSLTGAVGQARMGLLGYIVAGFQPAGRDVVFVPVGLAYDRVLEDRILTRASQEGTRSFRAPIGAVLAFVWSIIWRKFRGRFKGFGTAAASFGQPVSLRAYLAAHPETLASAQIEPLAAHLMAQIEHAVPVLPVPLVAAALLEGATSRDELQARAQSILGRLAEGRAVLKLAPQGLETTIAEGLAPLIARGLVAEDLTPQPENMALLGFYAASVQQRLLAVSVRNIHL
jgi:glycerol-3-phosphate O-acyltransferase